MKPAQLKHLPTVILLVLPVLLIAGCPVDSSQLGIDDSTQSGLDQPAQGTYWVQYEDGELMFFESLAYRGATAKWTTVKTAQPDWYTGPALYERSATGAWSRLTDDTDDSLDSIMQLYDVAPQVPSSDATASQ